MYNNIYGYYNKLLVKNIFLTKILILRLKPNVIFCYSFYIRRSNNDIDIHTEVIQIK